MIGLDTIAQNAIASYYNHSVAKRGLFDPAEVLILLAIEFDDLDYNEWDACMRKVARTRFNLDCTDPHRNDALMVFICNAIDSIHFGWSVYAHIVTNPVNDTVYLHGIEDIYGVHQGCTRLTDDISVAESI